MRVAKVSGDTHEVIWTTLPPAILGVEREKCGMGVEEKARAGLLTGVRLKTGERISSGVVALEREEKRARRKVGGLIWQGELRSSRRGSD